MDEWVAFLNARLDEKEHFAKAAHRLAQKHRQQMLREVEADRALLALKPWDLETEELMDTVLRIRLTVYSDHPGYRDEWKP